MEALFFYLFGGLAVITALVTITRRDAVTSAFWLIACFLNVAALFAMLSAQFIAVMQILIYAGAIMVFFLFVTMFLGEPRRVRLNRGRAIPLISTVTVLLLAWALTPLLFFVVYFCGLHSPRHLIDSFRELQMPGRVTLGVCLALTALTVIGALLLAQTQPQWDREEALLRLVFVGLAVLTVPHMTLLWRVKQQNRLNPGN